MTNSDRIFAFWQDSLSFILGAVLFLSPWLFGFEAHTTAAWNAHIVGAIIAGMALMALFAFQSWEEWVSGLLGAWLIISPWFLGFSAAITPTLTFTLLGAAAVILAIWSISEHERGHLSPGS